MSARAESGWTISLNGEVHRVEAGATVSTLLAELGQHPRTVAVEYNGEILKRDSFSVTILSRGDRIEVVRFVQGGLEFPSTPRYSDLVKRAASSIGRAADS